MGGRRWRCSALALTPRCGALGLGLGSAGRAAAKPVGSRRLGVRLRARREAAPLRCDGRSFYLVAALVMVLGNKAVLNAAPDTPLFFVCSQLVVAVILFRIGHASGYVRLPAVDRATCVGIWPLIACNVTGLAFNTLCLALVDASFYQVRCAH